MTTIQTYPWDVADHLETKEDIAAYLEAALEDGDPSLLVAALSDIARSKGMKNIASETGLESENLCDRATSVGWVEGRNPTN